MKQKHSDISYSGSNKPEDILEWAFDKFGQNVAMSCSFEAPILVHMAVAVNPDVRIFSIDTGRLPEETYQCAQEVEDKYGINIEWFFPKHEAIESLERDKGVFSFKKSVHARKECCGIRKVEPLSRALDGLNAWITSLRKGQSRSRNGISKIEYDETHGSIIKINPLADWTQEDVWQYMKKNKIPYNRLLDRGYMSIGCSCCTKAVEYGGTQRSGRWWWEQTEHKECGLHVNYSI